MGLLLQFEWCKVRKYRTFWVFLFLFVVTLVGVNAILYTTQQRLRNASAGQADLSLFSADRLWATTAWAGGFSVLVLGLLVIILVTNEFAFRTHRQAVMEGLSRGQFLAGKWLNVGVLTLFAWVSYVVVTCVLGSLNGLSATALTTAVRFGGYFLLKVALSLAVALCFALWLKRAGLAILLYLLYVLMLEGIIAFLLNRIVDGLGHYLPLKAIGALISNPVARLLPSSEPAAPVWVLLVVSGGYLAAFLVATFAYFRRTDL